MFARAVKRLTRNFSGGCRRTQLSSDSCVGTVRLKMGRLKAPENEFTPSDLPSDHRLVMIGIPRGSGNFECVEPNGGQMLVEVGTKLKKMLLITRGE